MRRFKRTYFFSLLVIFLDAAAYFIAFSFTFWLRFHSGFFSVPRGIPPLSEYYNVLPLLLVIFFIAFKSLNLYKEKRFFEMNVEARKIFQAFTISIMITLLLTYFYRETTYSRLYLILFVPIGFISIVLFRKLEIFLEKNIQKKYLRKSNILILGSGIEAEKLEKTLKKDFHWGFNVLETFPVQDILQSSENVDQLEKTFLSWKEQGIDEIILVSRGISNEQMVTIISECEKHLISFHLAPDIFSIITSRVDIISIDGITLLELKRTPLDKLHNRILKRMIDIFGSVFGLVFLSPFLLLIALLIKKDSTGPVFFKQERCGEDGHDFILYKFRTMSENAEAVSGPIFAKKDDPRRTKIGGKLRPWNIDELPQLFNVLKGDMSLVGPRPERPHFVEQFKRNIPRYMSRHLVKSGMTGWAQVHGLRGDTSIEERIKYDLYYIENWSVFLDIKILFLTFFSKENAY